MATPVALLPREATAHPAFDPLRPWLEALGERPGIGDLNALAAGQPVRFCSPVAAGAKDYEQRVFDTGLVDTRPGNRHDLFNALAWLAFPKTKTAINARHVAAQPVGGNARGPLRDLLTLIDEGGVIVACEEAAAPAFESLVRDFRWQALFWEHRAQLLADARFVLVGHSAYEKALDPYPGITCKALFLQVTRPQLEAQDLVETLDAAAAAWILALPGDAFPRRLPPLPVFGYPGWLPDSAHPGFYADRRWFRAPPAGKLELTA